MCKETLTEVLNDVQEYGNTEDSSPEALWGVSNEEVAKYILKNNTIIPCKFGEHLWRVVCPYQEFPRVIEVEVTNIRTFGKEHTLQVEVKPVNENEPNWMYYNWANYSDLFKSKDAANRKLAKYIGKGE